MTKVLQINVVYKKGSTGKIVYDIHSSLKKDEWDSYVIYGRGEDYNQDKVKRSQSLLGLAFNGIKARFTGMPYKGSLFSTRKILKLIEEINPDIIHLQCINGHFVNIYKLLDYIKRKKLKAILTLHAEFMHTGSCPHSYDCLKWKTGCGKCPYLWDATKSYFFDFTHKNWKLMHEAFQDLDIDIVAPSNWLLDRAKQSPITRHASFNLINNGIDIDIFKPRSYDDLLLKHGLKDEKILLHVTADFADRVKGGKYFLDLCNMLKDEKIKIILIGKNGKKKDLPDNVIYIDHINDPLELAKYYSMANVFVTTSVRETYPTVSLEAISCGTPVIAFDTGGVKETIAEGFGKVVEAYDVKKMKEWIVENISYKENLDSEDLERVRLYNSKDRMIEEYKDLYKRKKATN